MAERSVVEIILKTNRYQATTCNINNLLTHTKMKFSAQLDPSSAYLTNDLGSNLSECTVQFLGNLNSIWDSVKFIQDLWVEEDGECHLTILDVCIIIDKEGDIDYQFYRKKVHKVVNIYILLHITPYKQKLTSLEHRQGIDLIFVKILIKHTSS